MKTILFIFSILILSTFLFSTIINIPADYITFYDAISASVNGDTILVQPGTYLENINYSGKNITIGSLYLTTQDTSYISQTILDGFQNGGVVTFDSSEDSTAVLTGFTVTNGFANYSSPYDCGGGILCWVSTNPTLENLIVTGNSALDDGGGIYCYSSNPVINDVFIKDNIASDGGGGIFCKTNSNPVLSNVTLINNSAYQGGGFIHMDHHLF